MSADPGLRFRPEEPEAGGINWSRYLAALNRYKWLIVAITLLGSAGGVVATRFLKPEYYVRATIWIEPNGGNRGPIRAGELLNENYQWVELFRTFSVVDPVVQRLKLYLLPGEAADSSLFRDFQLADRFQPGDYNLRINGRQFTFATAEGVQISTGQVGDSIGRELGFLWQPPARDLMRRKSIKFSVTTPREASVNLLDNLSTQLPDQGTFLRLTLKGTDPQRTAATLNALAEEFVSQATELKKRKLTELTKILADQVTYAAQNLKDAETQLEQFRIQTITLPSEATPLAPGINMTQGTVIGSYFNDKVRLEQIKADRKAMEDVLARSQAGEVTVDAFQTIAAVRAAPDLSKALSELSTAEGELRALRFKYSDEFKPVRDVLERIRVLRTETIPMYARALINQLKIQEQDLAANIAAQSKDLQQIPVRSINEARLQRQVQSADNLYRTLQNRYEENKLAEASAIPDVKILDRAIAPTQPAGNRAPKILFMAIAGSLAAGVLLALLLDQMDKRFRYPDQVSKELGLPILGGIPAIKQLKPGERSAEETAQVVESFRSVRLNIAHSCANGGPIAVTISSAGAGDGKSLVSSNLALSFAEAGYRTLLVDGDTRRGELHRMFGVARVPGLVDCLMGRASADEVLVATSHRGLTLLPAGTRTSQSPELLGSRAMQDLLGVMKTRYDIIILDSPPLGAGVDPFVLGTATGNMVLVFRSGETDRVMAEAKLKVLDRLPIRVIGAVLNDIQAEGVYRYYSYLYGYVAEEEQEGAVAQLPAASANGMNGAGH
ncbi:MAG: GumC family protein [Gemmatimonadota bacterium]